MPRSSESARTAILDAAERLLRRGRSGTLDEVAHEVTCAKGLIHYHFHKKSAMLAAVAGRVSERRRRAWAAAFEADTPEAAIRGSWELLLREHRAGEWRAWIALCAEQDAAVGLSVSNETEAFAAEITDAVGRLLTSLGLQPTVPLVEVGRYLASVIQGMGYQLAAGAVPEELQGAYAAAWLGALSLTRSSP